jgi:hypothetical protein
MRKRTFAAGFIAVLLSAWVFTPVETTARGGGGFARMSGVAPGAFKFGAGRFGAFRFHRGFQQRYGLLRYGAYATVAGYSGSAEGTVGYPLPREGFAPPTQRVCRTDIHVVRSESSGMREIGVTRCFKE